MNKKNLAMAMAAVTVVGSAAPVFAATTPSEDNAGKYTVVKDKYKDIFDEVKKLVKENDAAIDAYLKENNSTDRDAAWTALAGTNSLNIINITVKDSDDDSVVVPKTVVKTNTVVDTDYVENKLKNLDTDEYVDFDITTKASTVSSTKYTAANIYDLVANNGKIIIDALKNVTEKQLKDGGILGEVAKTISGATTPSAPTGDTFASYFTVGTVKTVNGKVALEINIAEPASTVLVKTDAELTTSPTTQQKMSFANAKITLTEGDDRLDFSKPSIVDGALGDFAKAAATTTPGKQQTINVRVINAKQETVKATDYDALKAVVSKYKFDSTEIGRVYDEAKDLNDKDKLDGSSYDKDGTYKAVFFAEGKRLQGFSSYGKFSTDEAESGLADGNAALKLVIESTDEDDFIDGLKDLKELNNSYSDVESVAGDDRIETAIELSKSYYNNSRSNNSDTLYTGAVDNVVLVGSQAIVDGLVAGPLAAEKEGPLLLSSKDKLDNNVKNEIKRVMGLSSTNSIDSKKKVYIVGGENSVSKDVQKAIEDMGVKVERLSGDDRYATSLKIADKVELNDKDKAFVVGGTGLADAMSIAPVASQLVGKEATPIVVVDGKADKLSSDASDFLDSAKEVDIIGGENSVSNKVKDSIKDAIGRSVDRISGDDRQATNAEVIKEYYENDPKNVKNIFVAKDGSTKEDQLVDALAAGAIAGNLGLSAGEDEVSPAPIVLATDNLSSEQHVAISKVVNDKQTNKIVKVGGGIADSVINKLKDLLGM
ncbi:S-layer protein SlpA [Clostridioides difficile]|uniref:S-layer protein SlpA n=1 Tax=Clostridioides difficile TaxID=1496 RepID=UPI00093CF462|nr:S-layer protein SlpA [Clostridioides difficile]